MEGFDFTKFLWFLFGLYVSGLIGYQIALGLFDWPTASAVLVWTLSIMNLKVDRGSTDEQD